MKRPSRPELVAKFFPELKQNLGATTGDKEATIGINTRATEAILGDFIGLFDAAFAQRGPGVLAVRLSKDNSKTSDYLDLDDLQADADMAHRSGDLSLATALSDIAMVANGHNYEKGVLLMLVDSGFRLFVLDRDDPAKSITAMMEEQLA